MMNQVKKTVKIAFVLGCLNKDNGPVRSTYHVSQSFVSPCLPYTSYDKVQQDTMDRRDINKGINVKEINMPIGN